MKLYCNTNAEIFICNFLNTSIWNNLILTIDNKLLKGCESILKCLCFFKIPVINVINLSSNDHSGEI
jgi:hypothetical protein